MKTTTIILSILTLALHGGLPAGAQERGRDRTKPAGEPTTAETATATVKAVYDAAVDFVTSMATAIAKELPSQLATDPANRQAWDAQTKSLESIRATIEAKSIVLKEALAASTRPIEKIEIAVVAIGAMHDALTLQMATQRENQIVSPRDAASGLPTLLAARNESTLQLEVDLDRIVTAAGRSLAAKR
jgi:hypothetical protein